MESIIFRSAIIYFFVFIILRLSGKRTLGEMTTFDFVLLLMVSEVTQQAIIGDDYSITGAMLAITTLVLIDIIISLVTAHFKKADKIINSVPIIIFENGKPVAERLNQERLQEDDILEAARRLQGLESLEQIKYAILEKDGSISIIPKYLNPGEPKKHSE